MAGRGSGSGFVFISLVMALAGIQGPGVFADQVIKFDTAWQFYRGTPTGTPQSPSFSDASWNKVYLPHADSILLNTATASYYEGTCWYRKTFTPGASFPGKKVFLEIEAGMQSDTVWVNDSLAAVHPGGYTPVELDITRYLNFSSSNLIAIKLNNTPSATFPVGNTNPDFLYFGGLYRNVYLHLTDSLHITNPILGHITAGGGIFVTNSAVTTGASSALIYVKTNVLNEHAAAKSCGLTTSIRNAADQVVATDLMDTVTLASGANAHPLRYPYRCRSAVVDSRTPNLYTVHSVVSNGALFTDSLNTTMGIRTISFSKANGFQLNGQRFKWRGANRHQSFPYIGNALPNSGQYRDAQRLKYYGFNFVRMSHYNQSPAFFDACDRLGLLCAACLPGWQYFQNTTAFDTNCLAALRDMIRINRNHPSIVLWEAMPNESYGSVTTAYLDSSQALAHREFPRIAPGDSGIWTCGEETQGTGTSNAVYDVYISSSQHGVRNFAGSRPCAISEYADWDLGCTMSSTAITGCQDRVTRANEDSMVNQAMNQANGRSLDLGISWLTGDAVWSGFDYQTWSYEPMTTSGSIDLFRIPKFSAYFYQSQRSPGDTLVSGVKGGPMVYIASWWTPAAAQVRLKTLRVMFAWAAEEFEDVVTSNIVTEVKGVKYKTEGHTPWTTANVAQYELRHPIGTKARLAMSLMLYTGVRRSDAAKLGPQHIETDANGDLWFRFKPTKTERTSGKELQIPIIAPLKAILDASELGAQAFWKPSTTSRLPRRGSACGFAIAATRRTCRRLARMGCARSGRRSSLCGARRCSR